MHESLAIRFICAAIILCFGCKKLGDSNLSATHGGKTKTIPSARPSAHADGGDSSPIGTGWVEFKPGKKIHFESTQQGKFKNLDWIKSATYQEPVDASYLYDEATETESFTFMGGDTKRVEIRLDGDYRVGSRQFVGYVTIAAPLKDDSLVQIWGSDKGATQLMVRGFAEGNGSIGVGDFKLSGRYGKPTKVNIVHLQEDMGNKIQVYLDGKKVYDIPDNEKVTNNRNGNYFKYGCYGGQKEGGKTVVKWSKVRMYRDGKVD